MNQNAFETPIGQCPACKKIIIGAIGADEHPPCENDISICSYCGHVSKFNKDRTLSSPSEEELNEILNLEIEQDGKSLTIKDLSENIRRRYNAKNLIDKIFSEIEFDMSN